MTAEEALARVVGQIARRPVPLTIQRYETAEGILVCAQCLLIADANELARAFGPFPTVEALRASIPEVKECVSSEAV